MALTLQSFTTLPNSRVLTTLKEKGFENIVGKGENAGNQHFLLFPQCFLFCQTQNFYQHLILLSAYAFNLVQSRKLSFDKGLTELKDQ